MNVTYPYNTVITKLSYPYQMGESEKQDFLDKLKALRPGEPYKEVVERIGPPYMQTRISAMERDRSLGIRLDYYVKKLDEGVNAKYDQSVRLDFDNDAQLAALGIQNLSDLSKNLTNLPLTVTNWNDQTNEMEIVVRPETEPGKSAFPNAGKGSRK